MLLHVNPKDQRTRFSIFSRRFFQRPFAITLQSQVPSVEGFQALAMTDRYECPARGRKAIVDHLFLQRSKQQLNPLSIWVCVCVCVFIFRGPLNGVLVSYHKGGYPSKAGTNLYAHIGQGCPLKASAKIMLSLREA